MSLGDPKHIWIIIVCLDNYYKRYVLITKLEYPVGIGFWFQLEIRIGLGLGLCLGVLELDSDLAKFEMTIYT